MGYTTKFKGELKFTKEPTLEQLRALRAMFGECCEKHKDWNAPGLGYVDLELTQNLSGLCWNGAEKTYDLDKIVNVVLAQMRTKWPDFGLSGALSAQGEDIEDRWSLTIGDDGLAHKIKIGVGTIVRCPHCRSKFALDEGVQSKS